MRIFLLTITIVFTLPCLAQEPDDIGAMFRDKTTDDLEWYEPGYSNTGSDSYWIEHDTLFRCGLFYGKCIAMQDIDFTKKSVRQDDKMTVKNTQDKVYILTISLLSDRKTMEGVCFLGDATMNDPSSESLEALMKSMDQADNVFDYLKHWKKDEITETPVNNDYIDQILKEYDAQNPPPPPPPANPATSDSLSQASMDAVKAIEDFYKTNSDNNTSTSTTSSSASPFDTHLRELIDGMIDNYTSLNDGQKEDGDYKCKVQLEGTTSTYIYKSMLGEVWVIADYGEYDTEDEALRIYKDVLQKVSDAKTMPCSMVVEDEIINDMGRTQLWLPFDALGKLDPTQKHFHIELELMKSVKIDKDYKVKDIYMVVLRIKQNS